MSKLTTLLDLHAFDDENHLKGQSKDFLATTVKNFLKETKALEVDIRKTVARVESSANKDALSGLVEELKASLLEPLLLVRDTVNSCFLAKSTPRDIVDKISESFAKGLQPSATILCVAIAADVEESIRLRSFNAGMDGLSKNGANGFCRRPITLDGEEVAAKKVTALLAQDVLRLLKKIDGSEYASADPDHNCAKNRGTLFRFGTCCIAACQQHGTTVLVLGLLEDMLVLTTLLYPN